MIIPTGGGRQRRPPPRFFAGLLHDQTAGGAGSARWASGQKGDLSESSASIRPVRRGQLINRFPTLYHMAEDGDLAVDQLPWPVEHPSSS